MAIKSYCFCDVRVALTPGNITLTTLPIRAAMERERRGSRVRCAGGRDGIRRTRSSDFVPNAAPEPSGQGPVNAAGTSDVVHRRTDGPDAAEYTSSYTSWGDPTHPHATACENASQHVLHACFRKAVLHRSTVYEPAEPLEEDVDRARIGAQQKRSRYSREHLLSGQTLTTLRNRRATPAATCWCYVTGRSSRKIRRYYEYSVTCRHVSSQADAVVLYGVQPIRLRTTSDSLRNIFGHALARRRRGKGTRLKWGWFLLTNSRTPTQCYTVVADAYKSLPGFGACTIGTAVTRDL
ncbi:hypothetical protein ALC62_04984 [Cyphomyrmex costatus]|uniref:Uncharacterized protein n=1 Tax=Cyphomyrmex costatus TaxID=456900 RepID=A0A195CU53_9HYME|nr:hypothetical protein ALC62_04984 [Cyphomyrmex costatus]